MKIPVTDSQELLSLLLQLSGGALLGFLAGYALKKILKVVVVLAGLFVLGLLGLSYMGVVTVNFAALEDVVRRGVEGFVSWSPDVLAKVAPLSGGFVLGFILGLKKG